MTPCLALPGFTNAQKPRYKGKRMSHLWPQALTALNSLCQVILFLILPTGPQLGTHHSPQFKKTAELLQGPHKACWLSCFLCKWKANLLRFEPYQGLPPHGLGFFSIPRSSGPGVPQENKRTDRLAASAFRAQVVKPWQQADLVTQRCYLPLYRKTREEKVDFCFKSGTWGSKYTTQKDQARHRSGYLERHWYEAVQRLTKEHKMSQPRTSHQ